MKKLMILGASELQVPAIKCANNLGIKTIVLDYDSNAIGKEIASKFYEVSTLDYEKVLEIAKSENIDGIVTICSDRPIPIIAKIGEKLGLNTISYDTAMKATDKALMRNALKEKNVPIPKYYICNNYDEFEHAIESIEGKVVIKPSNNSGSRGVHFYNGKGELKELYEYSKQYSSNQCVLVEEYMEGPEVSVEVFVENSEIYIIQITDKITTGAPYFVEMGHTQPSALPYDIQDNIKEVAKKAVKALGIDNGPAHVEIKVTVNGAKIVEIGARLGGDHITTDLVPLSTGIDMVDLTIKMSLNDDIQISKSINKASAIRYFDRPIKSNNLFKQKVEKIFIENKDIIDIKSSNDRYGYFIIQEKDLEGIDDKINLLEDILKMEAKNV